MKMKWMMALIAPAFVAGCWTVRETDHVPIEIGSIPAGKTIRVQLTGFDATVTTFDTAFRQTTVTGIGPTWYDQYGRPYGGDLHTTTYTTTDILPRTEATPIYRNRATDALERAGCVLKTTTPDYQVEVRFDGPHSDSGDSWATFGWMVGTLFTADFGAQRWQAELRIHDLKTGKLVLSREFTERDEAVVWGLIPLFSPSANDRISSAVQQHLCLTALTDAAVAAAMAFFVGQ